MASKSSNLEQEQRAYIKFRSILKDSNRNILTDFINVCGDEALSFTTVKRWLNYSGKEERSQKTGLGLRDRYRQYAKNWSHTYVNLSEMIISVLLMRFLDILRSQREAYIKFKGASRS